MDIDLGDERTARIALAHAAPPGDRATHRLVTQHGAAATIRLAQGGTRPPGMTELGYETWRQKIAGIEDVLDLTERHGLTILTPDDAEWQTSGLADLGERAPLALWTKGDTGLLLWPRTRRVAVTGGRVESPDGIEANGTIVESLVTGDEHAIVSGGMYGVETTALRTSVLAGGRGVAVLAGGLDRLYPTGNEQALQHLGRYHLIVSEASPGTEPTRHRHEQTDRIKAALSGATVVIEGVLRVRTLAIADEAQSLGRPVGAFTSLNSVNAGPNALIRERKATSVKTGDDVRALLRNGISHPPTARPEPRETSRSSPLADPKKFGTQQRRDDDPGLTR